MKYDYNARRQAVESGARQELIDAQADLDGGDEDARPTVEAHEHFLNDIDTGRLFTWEWDQEFDTEGAKEIHEAASLFPRMSQADFEDRILNPIRANGLKQPIVLYEGKILDGRHRYEACIRLGIEPDYETYIGNNPVEDVLLAFNMDRRITEKAERAMTAGRLANGRHGGLRGPNRPATITQAQAAKRCKVSVSYVKRAQAILTDPELTDAVDMGIAEFSKAYKTIAERRPTKTTERTTTETETTVTQANDDPVDTDEGFTSTDVYRNNTGRLADEDENYVHIFGDTESILARLDQLGIDRSLPWDNRKFVNDVYDAVYALRVGLAYEAHEAVEQGNKAPADMTGPETAAAFLAAGLVPVDPPPKAKDEGEGEYIPFVASPSPDTGWVSRTRSGNRNL